MKAVPLGRVFALWNKAFMGVIAFSFPIERSWWPPREESTGKLWSCFSPGESSYIRNAMAASRHRPVSSRRLRRCGDLRGGDPAFDAVCRRAPTGEPGGQRLNGLRSQVTEVSVIAPLSPKRQLPKRTSTIS
jgi:hypothetical protein